MSRIMFPVRLFPYSRRSMINKSLLEVYRFTLKFTDPNQGTHSCQELSTSFYQNVQRSRTGNFTDTTTFPVPEASFELTKDLKLMLVLLKHDLLRVSICCSQNPFQQDVFQLVNFSRDIRHLLSPKMEKVGIAQADTFHSLCPFSEPTDTIPCLVQVKEYQHPIPNTFSYWCVKKKCDLHQKILQHTAVPSLLMLSSGR